MADPIIQLRGGTTAQQLQFIGLSREITVDQGTNPGDAWTLRVQDNQNPGGRRTIAALSDVNTTALDEKGNTLTFQRGVLMAKS